MNKEKFISMLKAVVVERSIKGIKQNIVKPAGRSPQEKYLIMSGFYHSLNASEQGMIDLIIRESAKAAIFQILALLDGVVLFEDEGNGKLELKYVSNEEEVLLNDSDEIDLHDLFNMED